jgi:hypothetical protein
LGRSCLDQRKFEQVSNLNSISFERLLTRFTGFKPSSGLGPTCHRPTPPLFGTGRGRTHCPPAPTVHGSLLTDLDEEECDAGTWVLDRVSGVDPPGQHVSPRVRYGTACRLIRKALMSLSYRKCGTGIAIPTRP